MSFLRRAACFALVVIPACGKKPAPPPVAPPKAEAAARSAAAAKELSRKVEDFTSARTKVVWSQYQRTDATDPRSNQSGSFLMGLDTKDGLGARPLISQPDNYSRPLLSADGETILYTRKLVTWDSQDVKHYTTVVMRTDWKGGAPIEVASGYATTLWVDPATHIEWVYAVRGIKPSPLVALEGTSLVRFQLAKPAEEQVVWSDTAVSPDNIQLSRDGLRASGLTPWPAAGLFLFEEEKDFHKLAEGSWASLAPDNSYTFFVLDDVTQSLKVFDENELPWTVPLTTTPDLAKGEVYHPRWTNHPRFLTLTGPYARAANPAEGSAVGKGGLSSEVFIGKFSEKLDKIDGWLRITDNALNDNYPDVWIEGGEKAALTAFSQTHEAKPIVSTEKWPATTEGAIYLWQNSGGKKTVKLSAGREIDCAPVTKGVARYGRSGEMIIDGGSFAWKPETAAIITDAVQSGVPLTFEFILHIGGDSKNALGSIATLPHARLSLRDGIISAETPLGIIGVGPVQGSVSHCALVAGDSGYSLTLTEADGRTSTKLSAAKIRVMGGRGTEIRFGDGGNARGFGLSHVAVYARSLTPVEVKEHAAVLDALPVPPLPATLKIRAKLVEVAPMSAADTKNSLIDCIYDVTSVIEGEYTGSRILIRHWALLDGKTTRGFPRRPGLDYDLTLQPFKDHPQLKEAPLSKLKAGDLKPWFDVSPPAVGR